MRMARTTVRGIRFFPAGREVDAPTAGLGTGGGGEMYGVYMLGGGPALASGGALSAMPPLTAPHAAAN